jgi:hypothetical protein
MPFLKERIQNQHPIDSFQVSQTIPRKSQTKTTKYKWSRISASTT